MIYDEYALARDIKFNRDMLIVDFTTGDLGDSLNRFGQYLCLSQDEKYHEYVWMKYLIPSLVRAPGMNPLNVTRDQITPLLCYYYGLGNDDKCRALRRDCYFPFAPNFERDKLGTTKYPWPHWFINDRGEKEFRWFDFADILGPDLWPFLLADKPDWFCKPLFWLGKQFCKLQIKAHFKRYEKYQGENNSCDVWQLALVAEQYGLLKYLNEAHPVGLLKCAEQYWIGWRQEMGFYRLWEMKLKALTMYKKD